MNLITPSQCLSSLKNFSDRVERLKKSEYSDKRFRTADLNRLQNEVKKIAWLCSIAVFNKNKERSKEIIARAQVSHIEAKAILEANNENAIVLYEKVFTQQGFQIHEEDGEFDTDNGPLKVANGQWVERCNDFPERTYWPNQYYFKPVIKK